MDVEGKTFAHAAKGCSWEVSYLEHLRAWRPSPVILDLQNFKNASCSSMIPLRRDPSASPVEDRGTHVR